LVIEKRYLRKKLARQWTERIIPSVINELNVISRHLTVIKVDVYDDDTAEITLLDQWNNQKRHTVDL
jgi:predicted transcriptional regulator